MIHTICQQRIVHHSYHSVKAPTVVIDGFGSNNVDTDSGSINVNVNDLIKHNRPVPLDKAKFIGFYEFASWWMVFCGTEFMQCIFFYVFTGGDNNDYVFLFPTLFFGIFGVVILCAIEGIQETKKAPIVFS